MEQLILVFLGWASSHIQGNSLKDLSSRSRFIIQLLLCALCGAVVEGTKTAVLNEFDPSALLSYIGTAFATSQIYYNTYFKHR